MPFCTALCYCTPVLWDWVCLRGGQWRWHLPSPRWWTSPGIFIGKNTQGSYGVVAAFGGSVSDLMVTAVCLQKGFGQVKICWPAIWDLLLALQALPMWPWANHFSAFPPSSIYLVYLVSQEALKSRDCILLSVCTVPNITGPQASWSLKDAVAIQVINVKEV